MTNALGKLIEVVRQDKDLSQRELAFKADVPLLMLKDIESGTFLPAAPLARKIGAVLNIKDSTIKDAAKQDLIDRWWAGD